MAQELVLIVGNTFPHKEALKSMGGKWDPNARGWMVPAAKAAEARDLVGTTPSSPRRARWAGRRGPCGYPGCETEINPICDECNGRGR